jgi:hypothetical protein
LDEPPFDPDGALPLSGMMMVTGARVVMLMRSVELLGLDVF